VTGQIEKIKPAKWLDRCTNETVQFRQLSSTGRIWTDIQTLTATWASQREQVQLRQSAQLFTKHNCRVLICSTISAAVEAYDTMNTMYFVQFYFTWYGTCNKLLVVKTILSM